MPMSNAKREANKRWNDANLKEKYDRIQLVVPKGQKEIIQQAAQQNGESVNGFIWRLIQSELGKRGAGGYGNSEPETNSSRGSRFISHDRIE